MVENAAWSKDELKASVTAYIDMQEKLRAGEQVSKKQYYRDLSSQFGRTEKAFEYRMQNISHVYSLMGREWIQGLRPAKNTGPTNAKIIELLINELEDNSSIPVVSFEAEVIRHKERLDLAEPSGVYNPIKSTSPVTAFSRDPQVKAWVLINAKGKCESCGGDAPFKSVGGDPYLEVHHVRQLADGGSDTISNAVALCPNCHRAMHFSEQKDHLKEELYSRIARLVVE